MRPALKRSGSAAALVAASALLITGCSSPAPVATPAAEDGFTIGDNVNIAVLGPAASFDPATQPPGGIGINYVTSAYESLVYEEPDGDLAPGIATEWEYSSPTELTMTLRDDVVFADGTELTPDLVVANLERYIETPGPNQPRLNTVDSVTIDGWTLDIKLNAPDLSIPQALSGGIGMMVSQAAIDDPTILTTETAGSGMWILDNAASVAGSTYVYTLNDGYTGPMEPGFTTITYKVINDLTAQLNALLSGDVDVALAQYSQRETAEGAGMAGLGVNINMSGIWLVDRDGEVNPALGELKVRQAMNYAVDRATIANALWTSYARPTDQLFADGTTGYDPELDDYYDFDVAKAKKLMKEAGYEDGFTLDVLSRETYGENVRLQATIPYLEAIGIKVNIVDHTSDFFPAFASKQYAAAQNQGNMFISSIGVANFLAPNATNNPFGSEDPELTELIDTAQSELDETKSAAAWQAVSKWVVENAWFLPIAQYQTHGIYNPKVVQGVEVTSVNPVPLPYTMRPAN